MSALSPSPKQGLESDSIRLLKGRCSPSSPTTGESDLSGHGTPARGNPSRNGSSRTDVSDTSLLELLRPLSTSALVHDAAESGEGRPWMKGGFARTRSFESVKKLDTSPSNHIDLSEEWKQARQEGASKGEQGVGGTTEDEDTKRLIEQEWTRLEQARMQVEEDEKNDDGVQAKTCPTYILHTAMARQGWDFVILFSLIYVALVAPPVMAFIVDIKEFPLLQIMDVIQDIIFLADIAINFFTSFAGRDDCVVTDNGLIALHYLRTWFAFDAVSSIPFSLFSLNSETQSMRETRLTRIIRVLKLLKMVRMTKIARMIPKLQARFQIRNSSLDMIRFIVSITLSAHWLGCFFFIVSRFEGFPEESWTRGILHMSVSEQYLMTLYWAVMTMTTIGYGDITPGTNAERLFALFSMWMGAGIFAYALTNVVTLVFNLNQEKVLFERLQDQVTMFLAKKKISWGLKRRIKTYMFYRFLNSHVDLFDSTNEVLKYLSPTLKGEVMVEITSSLFDGCPDLKKFGAPFVQAASQRLVITSVSPGELVIRPGTPFIHTYFVAAGIVEVLCVDDFSQLTIEELSAEDVTERPLTVQQWLLTKDCVFGENASLLGAPSNLAVFSLTHADIYMLDGKIVYELLVDAFSIDDARVLFVEARRRAAQQVHDFTTEACRLLKWNCLEDAMLAADNGNLASVVEAAGDTKEPFAGLSLTLAGEDEKVRVIRAGLLVLKGMMDMGNKQGNDGNFSSDALLAQDRSYKLIKLLFGGKDAVSTWKQDQSRKHSVISLREFSVRDEIPVPGHRRTASSANLGLRGVMPTDTHTDTQPDRKTKTTEKRTRALEHKLKGVKASLQKYSRAAARLKATVQKIKASQLETQTALDKLATTFADTV